MFSVKRIQYVFCWTHSICFLFSVVGTQYVFLFSVEGTHYVFC